MAAGSEHTGAAADDAWPGLGPQAGRLPREFFARPATEVAPDLLGCVLWYQSAAGLVAVRLVEVEAYEGAADPASHAFRGQTARNAVMFGPPGHLYVYFTYGMHFCANLVCLPSLAVLLRAGEVVAGAGLAARRRFDPARERDLARGPARLCQALAIDRGLDGADACAPRSPLGIGPRLAQGAAGPVHVMTGPRVGISQAADRPWRYWLADDPHVSAYRPVQPRTRRAKPVTGPDGMDGTMVR
jgi:DNA-3-methyladenine glycosylase